MGKRRNTAVASVEAVPDIREAARQEAGREGLSIGSWLDGVMAEHAAALGVDTAQLDPAQRVEAVMARLDRVAPRQTDDGSGDTGKLRTGVHANSADSFSEPDQPIRNAEQDTRRSGMPAVALLRESFEDMAMDNDRAGSAGDPLQTRAGREADAMRTAASSSVNGTSTIDMPSEAARAARAASRQAAQRLEIETKLNALFKALDRTPRRTDHAAAATAADRQDDEPETREALLGRTAITPSWRLEKAIGEIAQRQSFLDRQAQADTASTPVVTSGTPFGSPRAAADDLRRHFVSPPRTEMSAVPHVATHRPSAAASIFTTLQGDIARLAERLDTVDATRRPPAPPAQRSEAGLDALGRQVETLSAKIDAMRDQRVPLEAIDRLSRRIEDVHAEVSTRMTAQASQPAIDMASIEALIRDVVDRADRTGKAAPDLHGLESAVHDLAAKLAMAERSQDGSEVLASLQAQVRVLAERMDKTDAGLTAIVAIERSLGEVFGQMGEMRDAVVQTAQVTAQTVARESIQAALEDGRRERLRGAEPGLPFVDQVNQEFAELRSDRDEADKRLHAILAALNTSLERVVDRLGALEDEAAGVRAATADRTSPSLLSRQPLALDFTEAAGVTPEVGGALVAPREVEDLIEPGVTSRQWSNPAQAGTPAAVPSAPDPTSFIAAARRAAQAATAEHSARLDAQLDRQRARPAADRGKAKRSATGMVARPLVIALASLAILAGAAQIIRLSLVATDPAADATATASAPPTVAKSDAGVPAVAPEKPAADADLEAPVPSVPPTAPETAAPDAAEVAAPPAKALPTMARGAAANVAAVQAADLSARAAAAGVLPAGLRAAADAGEAGAEYELGLRYGDGRGVARDLKMAATWFGKAADQGLAPAAYRLGSLYEKGLGVTRDAAQSIAWYQKAADAGNVRAMHNLAVMLAEGSTGKPDYAAAANWFTRAAEAGVRDSQFNLAILYARGMGVDVDLGKSYLWFSLAASQGDTDAGKKREEVAGRLEPKALADAKAAVAAFKPAPVAPQANEVAAPAGGWDEAPHDAGSQAGSQRPSPVSRL